MLRVALLNELPVTFMGTNYNFKAAPNGDLWIFQDNNKHIATFGAGQWLYVVNVPDIHFDTNITTVNSPTYTFKVSGESGETTTG